ncbi:HNH endonuclease [Bdellovibrio sp. HCB185ZH]|uniref:HNH endonuclease n=1 Tax=Bdellovibrio sp. HCB185ZH TaxID=3394235 RepID=UPI0039A44EB7
MKTLAQRERDLLHEVLLTIKEIDSRRTFLELGFGSLFDYLVKGVGYSEGSAQRRIDAARMMREIPEIAEKIQRGELKLNQISLIQKASREVFKNQSITVTTKEKLQVINDLCGKNHTESQQKVAEFFDLPVLQPTHQKTQADESVRVEFTLSKEAYAKVKHAQSLLSHAVPSTDMSRFLEFLAEKVIQQKAGSKPKKSFERNKLNTSRMFKKSKMNEPEESKKSKEAGIGMPRENPEKVSPADVSQNAKSTATVAVNRSKPSAKDVKRIRIEQGCCQFVDPVTGRRCENTWRLQVDHKHSQWAAGGHEIDNLQLLCAGHNKLKYRTEAGIRYLS